MKRKSWIIAVFFVLIGIISAIIYWFCLKPEVSDVLEQNGYQMIAQTEESMEITIHKKDLPEECFTSEGYEFKENEFLLYQDGINTIYLEKVMYDDDAWEYLYFGIAFSYNIPAYGTVIVPYKINVKSDEVSDYRMSGKLASKDVQDKEGFWADAAYFRGQGCGERVSFCVKSDVVHQAEEYITIQLGGINYVTYMED